MEERNLDAVTTYDWVKVETVLDSGAAESVAPSSVAPWVKVCESVGSKNGQTYQSASGTKIASEGEKKLQVVTEDGIEAEATFQVADVTRPLSAVSKICDKGIMVVFTQEGGYIQNGMGHRTFFRHENNVYMMDLYMKAPKDFHRQS